MPPLPTIKPRELLRVLSLLGYFIARQRGSHITLRNSNDMTVVVPFHKCKDIAKGTLRNILRDADVTVEELIKLLKK